VEAPAPAEPPAPPGAEARARRYHRAQLALHGADAVLTAGVLAAWVGTGAAGALARGLEAALGAAWAVPPAVALVVGASAAVLTFPLDVAGGLVLPRRAGLSTQSAGAWLADRAKLLAIAAALTLAATAAVYAALRWSPRWWWLLGAGLLEAGAILLTAVVPVWVAPLFYRLAPLADAALRERLLALAARVGVPAVEVLVADFSRKGRTANAAVVGLGRTRRVVVSDTLLDHFPPAEVEVVLAHELAHHARGHLAQALALQGGLLLLTLWVADRALRAWGPGLGLTGPADPAGVPLLALVLSGLGLAVTPVAAAWSRHLEREADRAALALTDAPDAFVGAMERLGALNLAERRPGRLRQLLLASHPSLEERIAAARAPGGPGAPRPAGAA
jgi:STE24 endopeptidase